MNGVFADTSYFVAVLLKNDVAHAQAVAFPVNPRRQVITTHAVLVELGNFLSRPHDRRVFLGVVDALKNDRRMIVVPTDAALFELAINLFRSRLDKEWSLTDCMSMLIMRRFRITDALTTDHHFTQAGFNVLLKV